MKIKIDKNKSGNEQLIKFECSNLGIKGVVAIHSTKLGPALGGCRVYDELSLKDGIKDAIKLAKAMTYKNAIINLPYGGGKTVIIKNGVSLNETMRSFSKVLNLLNGDYLTTDDVGTNIKDMNLLKTYSKHVRGSLINDYQIPATSYGVYQSLKAAIYYWQNTNSLKNLKIAVQGLGKVGFSLCKFLHKEGCILYVSDINKELEVLALRQFNATSFKIEDIKELDLDVFSPCALGGVITKDNYSDYLKLKYIIGGANNPISHDFISNALYKNGTIYIPDFLSNAGGVIDIDCENYGYNESNVFKRVEVIYTKTIELLKESSNLKLCPLTIATNYVQKALS